MSKLPDFKIFDAWAKRIDDDTARDEIVAKEFRRMRVAGDASVNPEMLERKVLAYRAMGKFFMLCAPHAKGLEFFADKFRGTEEKQS